MTNQTPPLYRIVYLLAITVGGAAMVALLLLG
jgi:hypothetical protein